MYLLKVWFYFVATKFVLYLGYKLILTKGRANMGERKQYGY
jgi:hypothetical protein